MAQTRMGVATVDGWKIIAIVESHYEAYKDMVITNKSTRDMGGSLRFFYACIKCGSESPKVIDDAEAAYAAAMKRDRAKGKWETVSESAWDGGEYKCSACGWKCCDDEFGDDPTEDYRFCPNCGADMRKEKDDDD